MNKTIASLILGLYLAFYLAFTLHEGFIPGSHSRIYVAFTQQDESIPGGYSRIYVETEPELYWGIFSLLLLACIYTWIRALQRVWQDVKAEHSQPRDEDTKALLGEFVQGKYRIIHSTPWLLKRGALLYGLWLAYVAWDSGNIGYRSILEHIISAMLITAVYGFWVGGRTKAAGNGRLLVRSAAGMTIGNIPVHEPHDLQQSGQRLVLNGASGWRYSLHLNRYSLRDRALLHAFFATRQ